MSLDLLDQVAIHEYADRLYLGQAVPNPAAGTDWSFTVPGHQALRIKAAGALLTPSAAAANRQVDLQLFDGNVIVAHHLAIANVVASVAQTFAWLSGGSAVAGPAGQNLALLFDCVVGPGWSIRTVTTAIQAADQWSGITLLFERVEVGISNARELREYVEHEEERGGLYSPEVTR